MRAGLLIVVITISASAQTREEIATLKAQVAALQSLVASLQTSNTTLQSQIGSLRGQVGSLQTSNATLQSQVGSLQTNDTTLQTGDTALQTQVTAPQNQLTMAQPVLGLAPFVSVDPNPENGVIGPYITFKGANIHIRSKLERSRACVRMIARLSLRQLRDELWRDAARVGTPSSADRSSQRTAGPWRRGCDGQSPGSANVS